MSSYTDYAMFNNNSNVAGNLYDQQMTRYQQQLSQYQQNNPYNNSYNNSYSNPYNSFQPTPIKQQPTMQTLSTMPEIQSRNDLYLQSLFMEFLRSPEMNNFTTEFYQRFSQFYKHKTGLEFNDGNTQTSVNNTRIPVYNNQSQPQPQPQPNNVQIPVYNTQPQIPLYNNIPQVPQVPQVPQDNIQQPIPIATEEVSNTPKYIIE